MDAIVSKTKIACNGMTLGQALRSGQKSPEKFFGKIRTEVIHDAKFKATLMMEDYFNGEVQNWGFKN